MSENFPEPEFSAPLKFYRKEGPKSITVKQVGGQFAMEVVGFSRAEAVLVLEFLKSKLISEMK